MPTDSRISTNRYLPCLLTRLTDEHPFTTVDSDYSESFSLDRLKRDILQNLTMLLNAHVAPTEAERIRRLFPEVGASGYLFGVDSFVGRHNLTTHVDGILRHVRDAIVRYEPRVVPESVHVTLQEKQNAGRTGLDLCISCRLAVKPLTDDMLMRLQLDLETGEATFTR